MFKILLLIMAIQDVPVAGPLTDALDKRFDKFSERVEALQNGNSLIYEKLEQAQSTRFAELLAEVRALREDRTGLVGQLAEFRKDRDGIFKQIQEARAEIREAARGWTPIQNLVDRLTALVWKLFLLVASLVVVVVVIGSIGLFLYVRLRSKIVSLAKGV